MFGFVGNVAAGGWNALDKVSKTIGSGVSYLAGGFFPTPQREKVESDFISAAGGAGMTYRPTAPENPSMVESGRWAYDYNWLGTPYQEQYSTPVKIQESKYLESLISPKTKPIRSIGDTLVDVLGGARQVVGAAREIRTFWDELQSFWKTEARPVIRGEPRAGYPEGRDEQHLNVLQSAAANTISAVKGWGSEFIKQFKGLFNLDYPAPEGPQPAFAIKHELEPTPKMYGILISAAVVIIIVALVLGRKK